MSAIKCGWCQGGIPRDRRVPQTTVDLAHERIADGTGPDEHTEASLCGKRPSQIDDAPPLEVESALVRQIDWQQRAEDNEREIAKLHEWYTGELESLRKTVSEAIAERDAAVANCERWERRVKRIEAARAAAMRAFERMEDEE